MFLSTEEHLKNQVFSLSDLEKVIHVFISSWSDYWNSFHSGFKAKKRSHAWTGTNRSCSAVNKYRKTRCFEKCCTNKVYYYYDTVKSDPGIRSIRASPTSVWAAGFHLQQQNSLWWLNLDCDGSKLCSQFQVILKTMISILKLFIVKGTKHETPPVCSVKTVLAVKLNR